MSLGLCLVEWQLSVLADVLVGGMGLQLTIGAWDNLLFLFRLVLLRLRQLPHTVKLRSKRDSLLFQLLVRPSWPIFLWFGIKAAKFTADAAETARGLARCGAVDSLSFTTVTIPDFFLERVSSR